MTEAATQDFTRYVYSLREGYNEPQTRKAFHHAVPLRTIVIYCYDPRAVAIPTALAAIWPDEVYPGELVLDEAGSKIGSTATIFPIVVAGGRAVDALRSISIGQHLFGVQNIVVVHHTNCGTTSFTRNGLIDAFKAEQGVDLADVYEKDSLAINDFGHSLRHDVDLLRASPGVPKSATIFGLVYNIDTDQFTQLIQDRTSSQEST